MLKVIVFALMIFWSFASAAGVYAVITSKDVKDGFINTIITLIFMANVLFLAKYGWSL